jgi:hypothetical protein
VLAQQLYFGLLHTCLTFYVCCLLLLQGEYDVRVVARDTAGEELMCVDVHFEMLPPSFVQKFLPGSWLGKQKGSQSQSISEAGPAIARRLMQALRGN